MAAADPLGGSTKSLTSNSCASAPRPNLFRTEADILSRWDIGTNDRRRQVNGLCAADATSTELSQRRERRAHIGITRAGRTRVTPPRGHYQVRIIEISERLLESGSRAPADRGSTSLRASPCV
jgi:hypothetical protein